MTRPRSSSPFILWSAAAALAFGGCGSASLDSGQSGAGGSTATGGSTSTGGSIGTGGVHASTGGQPGATGGVTASGGATSTGGYAPGVGGRGGGAGPGTAGRGAPGTAGRTGGTGVAGMTGTATGGSGGATSASGMSAGCGKTATIASSMYNNGTRIPITAANMDRRYILNVPKNYDSSKPYRLVIAFHELNGNDVQMYQNGYYHLMPLDTAGTTIFVAPNGQNGGKPCSGVQNGESGCGWPNPSNSDFALADAVVQQVEQNFCVDTNRIFATGWSYGGAMSYETGCGRPQGASNGYIRAIAVYSGSAQITAGPCPPTKPVAYYASHGTQDSVLQYSGGVSMAQNYAKANGCTWATPPQATSASTHICTDLMGCSAGYPVEFCSFVGPHTPDPSDTGQRTSWEYANVWKFFSQF